MYIFNPDNKELILLKTKKQSVTYRVMKNWWRKSMPTYVHLEMAAKTVWVASSTQSSPVEMQRWSCPAAVTCWQSVAPGVGRMTSVPVWQHRTAVPSQSVPSTSSVDCVAPSLPHAELSAVADPPAHLHACRQPYTTTRDVQSLNSTNVVQNACCPQSTI